MSSRDICCQGRPLSARFSRHAPKLVPRLRALREFIASLPAASGSSVGAEQQPELLPLSPSHARPAGNFLPEH
jgi:hypothetical protein